MTTWAEFEASAPEIASTGWRLLDRDDTGQALLATVSGSAAPRIPQLVRNGAVRDSVAAGWSFETDESYELFEFSLEDALLGRRDDAEEWPPRYSSWRSG